MLERRAAPGAMPRCPLAASLLAVPVACVAGCKKSAPAADDGGTAATSPGPTAGEVCESIFGGPARHLAAHCSPDDQKRRQHAYLLNLASGAVARCKGELDPLLARGGVRIDAAGAQRCARALEDRSWKDTLLTPDVSRYSLQCRGICASGKCAAFCGAG